MRRRSADRRMRRLAQLAKWFETFWSCECDYNNIATYRCYHCGARPPRRLRAEFDAVPVPEKPLVTTDA